MQHFFQAYKLSYAQLDSLPRPLGVPARYELLKACWSGLAAQQRQNAKLLHTSPGKALESRSINHQDRTAAAAQRVRKLEQLWQLASPGLPHDSGARASKHTHAGVHADAGSTRTGSASAATARGTGSTGSMGSASAVDEPTLASGPGARAPSATLAALLDFDQGAIQALASQQAPAPAAPRPEVSSRPRRHLPLQLSLEYEAPAALPGRAEPRASKPGGRRLGQMPTPPQARQTSAPDAQPERKRSKRRHADGANAQAGGKGRQQPSMPSTTQLPKQGVQGPGGRGAGRAAGGSTRTEADWARLTTASIRNADR